MASEGAISAFSKVFHLDFGKVKMGLDLSFVLLSAIVSLVWYHRLEGIREGTIVAAVLVGMLVHVYQRRLTFVDALLQTDEAHGKGAAAPAASSLVITIERELGTGGHELGERIAKELGLAFYDYAVIEKTAEQTGLQLSAIQSQEERVSGGLIDGLVRNSYAMSQARSEQDVIFEAQSRVIRDMADAGGCVIVGRLGSYVLRDRPNCFHVFLSGSEAYRARRIAQEDHSTVEQARQRLAREDAFRHNYCRHFTGEPWGLARHYALTLDMSRYGVEGALPVLREAVEQARHMS